MLALLQIKDEGASDSPHSQIPTFLKKGSVEPNTVTGYREIEQLVCEPTL